MKKTSIFYVVSTIKISCCRLSVQGSVKLSIIMVRPGSVAGSTPEGVRKSLVQQQSKITVRDPSAHAVRQVQDCELELYLGLRSPLVQKYQRCTPDCKANVNIIVTQRGLVPLLGDFVKHS